MKKSLLSILSLLTLGTTFAQYHAVSPCYDSLYTTRISDGATIERMAIVLDSGSFNGVTSLAQNPVDGKTYIAVNRGGGIFNLAELNLTTGAATYLMTLTDKIASVAFTTQGACYAISGDGSNTPSVLYSVNLTAKTMTSVIDLAPTVAQADGEALAYNTTDGLMYRLTGRDTLQTINLSTLATTKVALSQQLQNYGHTILYQSGSNDFLMVAGDSTYTLSTTGTVTGVALNELGDDCGVKGILFNNAFASVTEIKSEELISVYPNPSNGNISIASSENIRSIVITNANGQIIENKEMFTSLTNFNIDNLDKGIYFVTCALDNGKNITKRVIVQ